MVGFDSTYLHYARVALLSLLSNAEGPYRVYCFGFGLTDAEQVLLEALFEGHDAELVLIPVDPRRFDGWKPGVEHVSTAVFYRLLIPELVAEPRVVSLDVDLLVTCDLGPLFQTDLGSAWIAGCVDGNGTIITGVPRAAGDPYLNAGVLVMDLDQLRANDFRGRCESVHRAYRQLPKLGDQCIINKVAEGRKAVVSPRWNMLAHDLGYGQVGPRYERFGGKGILHFSGSAKPWTEWGDSWSSDLWFSYARDLGLSRSDLLQKPVSVNDFILLAMKYEQERQWEQAARIRKDVIRTLGKLLSDPGVQRD